MRRSTRTLARVVLSKFRLVWAWQCFAGNGVPTEGGGVRGGGGLASRSLSASSSAVAHGCHCLVGWPDTAMTSQ